MVFTLGAAAVGYAALVGFVGRGQGDAGQNACAANLRKLHDSLVAYANDNDDNLPAPDWCDALTPYLPLTGASLRCPSERAGGYGYAFNEALVRANLNTIANPDDAPLFFDVTSRDRNEVSGYPGVKSKRHTRPAVVYVSGRTVPDTSGGGGEEDVRAQCQNNLKRLAVANLIYANDNDDLLPPAKWMDAVTPYTTGFLDAFRCPALAAKSYGYAFNSALVLTNTTAPEHPDTVPMVFDSSITSRNAVSAYALPNPARHVSGVTAYLDGHVSP